MMSNPIKELRKTLRGKNRKELESIIRRIRPKSKPWMSNVADLRDQAAILLYTELTK